MTMTARDLIRELEDLDPDTEVRIMSQPSWPFEYAISHTWAPTSPEAEIVCDECDGLCELDATCDEYHHMNQSLDEDHEPQFEDHETSFTPHGNPESVVYLVEGTQLAYGTKTAWNGQDW